MTSTMNNDSGFSEDFLEIMRNLIAYFILRQHIVMLAMIDHKPIILSGKIVGMNLKPYRRAHTQRMLKLREEKTDNSGTKEDEALPTWKGDWHYFPHGAGCLLRHVRTQEPIEWDGPDPDAFRIDWFINHLNWRLKNEAEDPYIQACVNWLKTQQADMEVVQKAIYRLIDIRILKAKQRGTCAMAVSDNEAEKDESMLPRGVIEAALDAIDFYHDRQKLSIEALVELRPDFVLQVAEDQYLLPDIAQRLKALCQHLEATPKAGRKIETGIWREVWNYDIRYATCTLTQITTEEPIRWATADPLTTDYSGFMQHLHWRIGAGKRDKSVETLYKWIEEYSLSISNPPASISSYISSGLYHILDEMIERNIIDLTRNERSLLIRRPT